MGRRGRTGKEGGRWCHVEKVAGVLRALEHAGILA
jgi:hypothetical protein